MIKPFVTVFIVTIGILVISVQSFAQNREHLTYEEIELVRDIQDVEFRMKIFAKAIERRLLVIEGVVKLTEPLSHFVCSSTHCIIGIYTNIKKYRL